MKHEVGDLCVNTDPGGGQPYGEAQYVNIAFLLILATQSLHLACTEWQRRVPNMQTWTIFKAFFTEAHRENRMISQTALRWGYHTANMVTSVPAGHFQTCDITRHYDQPIGVEDLTPRTTTALAKLATIMGVDRATIASLTKSLADLAVVTKAQAEELLRLVNSGHITPMPDPDTHGSAIVVCGNGRQRRTRNNQQGNGERPM
jgi:hypothetical protein